jgi:hypothetical protein
MWRDGVNFRRADSHVAWAVCAVTAMTTDLPVEREWEVAQTLTIVPILLQCQQPINRHPRQSLPDRKGFMAAPTRRERIEAMLVETPDDLELRYMLAMEHISAGDDVGAVRCFEELMALAPNYPPAYHQAGRALQRLGRGAEARAVLSRGIPVAQKQGDHHAAGEMTELLQTFE